jgi:hypothetical protein
MENLRSMWTCCKRSKSRPSESYVRENVREEDWQWATITRVHLKNTQMMTIIRRMGVTVTQALALAQAQVVINQS